MSLDACHKLCGYGALVIGVGLVAVNYMEPTAARVEEDSWNSTLICLTTLRKV